ncbi:LysR family transcriptional regulator [Cumulibacter soli]|uniref:LysR family transcriptional regulator n=1 Tax=Cumulibacter soli TaxID=2546344 RepID=UPI001067294B|nr:LysR family transcriptional regulator [Cumulibacter soli]
MEVHQLRYAVEVHRRGSFTAAAEILHVSQSGVSAQIAKLEKELGTRFFERGPRIATPTTSGAALLPLMARAITDIAQIRQAADELLGLCRGTVRIGTVIGCTIPGYLNAFATFRTSYPDVAVLASEGNSVDLVDRLVSGELDIALLAHTGSLPAQLTSTTLIDEPIDVGVPSGHAWQKRSAVRVADLATADVISLAAGTGVRAALQQTCEAGEVEITPIVEAHSPETVHSLAERNAGVAVLSRSMIGEPLTAVPIVGARQARLSLASRKAPDIAARAFLGLLAPALLTPRDEQ